MVAPWIVVTVNNGVVTLVETSRAPTVAVLETLRLTVERVVVVKAVKAPEVVAFRVSQVRVDDTDTLVATNRGVVMFAVALTVWAVTRPVTARDGTVYALVILRFVVVMVPETLNVPFDHNS